MVKQIEVIKTRHLKTSPEPEIVHLLLPRKYERHEKQ